MKCNCCASGDGVCGCRGRASRAKWACAALACDASLAKLHRHTLYFMNAKVFVARPPSKLHDSAAGSARRCSDFVAEAVWGPVPALACHFSSTRRRSHCSLRAAPGTRRGVQTGSVRIGGRVPAPCAAHTRPRAAMPGLSGRHRHLQSHVSAVEVRGLLRSRIDSLATRTPPAGCARSFCSRPWWLRWWHRRWRRRVRRTHFRRAARSLPAVCCPYANAVAAACIVSTLLQTQPSARCA